MLICVQNIKVDSYIIVKNYYDSKMNKLRCELIPNSPTNRTRFFSKTLFIKIKNTISLKEPSPMFSTFSQFFLKFWYQKKSFIFLITHKKILQPKGVPLGRYQWKSDQLHSKI